MKKYHKETLDELIRRIDEQRLFADANLIMNLIKQMIFEETE